MKVKEIAQRYGLESESFSRFANHGDHGIKVNILTSNVADGDVETLVAMYKEYAAVQERMINEMGSMLLTTGENFDGYRITKYCGIVSAEEAREIGFINFITTEAVTSAVSELRSTVLMKLKEAVFRAGGNALTGVDFKYVTTQVTGEEKSKMLVCVFGSGSAVTAEKE